MRRALPFTLVVLLLVGPSALADATPSLGTPVVETQPCTAGVCNRSGPPTSTIEGLSLGYVRAYVLAVCAATGQTLSGAGTVQAYWCDSRSGQCMHQKSADQAVTLSGEKCQLFDPFWLPFLSLKADSVVFAASGVTVSGGAGLTVYLYPAS